MEGFKSIKEELIDYCNKCLNDVRISEFEDYISCQKHKKAVKRLLNDFERENTAEFPYYWDEAEAKRIVKWFALLHHSKGELAGKPIILNTWEKFVVCQIYGWRRVDNGRRRFTKSFTEVARKNAKSQIEGGITLYEMSVTSVKNQEICECFTAGTKIEQSKLIFDECVNMLQGSELACKFKIGKKIIVHKKTGSFLKPLSREDKKSGDGTNPHLLVLDRKFVEGKSVCIGEG